ncbi:hypothetical protein B0H66DRAFT_601190 [Apodospora peruviana]|uniref:Peptidase M4 C-terminal domain-containing protein n=1 Tax=Apodospora peruviana TaxID=516989 RepID=A0AAE0M7R6_9PEZI|nr:hypothetical protein B0H66DRAFT_601190 [Apodospora peruviana]
MDPQGHVCSIMPPWLVYNMSKSSDEKLGHIWWKVATGGKIPISCTFIQFADAIVDAAEELYDEEAAKIVRDAWNTVGVSKNTTLTD